MRRKYEPDKRGASAENGDRRINKQRKYINRQQEARVYARHVEAAETNKDNKNAYTEVSLQRNVLFTR